MQTLAPVLEMELAGQAVQAVDAVLPAYAPAVHSSQAASEDPPVAELKVPAKHDRHTLDALADVEME